ncbi:chromate transporter [bacterium]|nr:chromate transporter [bacterium]
MPFQKIQMLWDVFVAFGKVGVLAYGGGPSMIPLMQEEVVEANRWLTVEEFTDALAMGNALPGPIATKMSAYVGYKIAGGWGAFAGLAGTVFPSLVLMLVLATFFFEYRNHPKVQSMLKGVRPAVVALLAQVTYEVAQKSYPFQAKMASAWGTYLITGATFGAVIFLGLHPAWAILASAVIGYLVY